MSDLCPRCDAALSGDGSHCKECGWDVELMVAEWKGEGTELPDEDFDYDRYLQREHGVAAPAPWGKLLLVLVAICLVTFLILLGFA